MNQQNAPNIEPMDDMEVNAEIANLALNDNAGMQKFFTVLYK